MLELRVMNDGQSLPLFDLPAAYGREKAARELGDTIEGLIAFLDEIGGDPDIELNGDELDGDNSEDSFHIASGLSGPGCPISDPGEDSDEDCCSAADDDPRSGFEPGSHRRLYDGDIGSEDDEEPTAWIEWQSRGRHKHEHGAERMARDRYGNPQREDDEDDDPDTGVEDDPRGFDPEEDDDRERDVAWPERIRQGLVGGYTHTDSEDDEPCRVPAFAHPDVDPERGPIANDNGTGGRA